MSDLVSLAGAPAATAKTGYPHPAEIWPGVPDPAGLLAAITEWLTGYGNHATRRTYAEGLGLPVSTTDLAAWIQPAPREKSGPENAGPNATGRARPAPAADQAPRHSTSPGQAAPEATWHGSRPGSAAPEATRRSASPGPAAHQATRHGTNSGPAAHQTTRHGSSPGPAAHEPPPQGTSTGREPTHPGDSGPTTAATTDPAEHQPWLEAVLRYAEALHLDAPTKTPRSTPPPAARGRLRTHHWFRWCATRTLDPTTATSTDVKAWLDTLATADAAPATRDRMLATVKALYGYLADVGLVAGNPAALNRRRLGLAAAAAGTSGTVTLTTRQVRALYTAAGAPRRGAGPVDTARALAVVALFTLGLRVSELCGLDRADLHVTRGRRALRVLGKGGKTRVVYLSEPAERALLAYLKVRDAAAASAETTLERRTQERRAAASPLLETRTGNRYQRQAIWQLLRRITASGGPELEPITGAMHPHALRHFYVTTAVEAGAQLVHVQADVGHSSIDTTQQTYDHAARAPERSAVDLVAASWFEPEG